MIHFCGLGWHIHEQNIVAHGTCPGSHTTLNDNTSEVRK